jgi:hypothetical protein
MSNILPTSQLNNNSDNNNTTQQNIVKSLKNEENKSINTGKDNTVSDGLTETTTSTTITTDSDNNLNPLSNQPSVVKLGGAKKRKTTRKMNTKKYSRRNRKQKSARKIRKNRRSKK